MHSQDFRKSEIRRISKWRHVSPDKAIFKKTTVICVKFTHKRIFYIQKYNIQRATLNQEGVLHTEH